VSAADLLRRGPVLAEGSAFERLRCAEGIAFDPALGIGALVADPAGRAALAAALAGEPGPCACQLDALGLPASGGRCGTDERHLAALADRLTARRG